MTNTPSTPKNDDRAELSRRRRMAAEKKKVIDNQLLSPSPLTSPKGIRSALQSPSATRLLNYSSATSSPLLSKVQPAVSSLPVSKEQMNKLFDEWIKIAADNKINANNTWNLALIDYFSELSILRDGDSINFQKASCTLDGCVKIYTSRVDSVANETGKLLTGLADNEKASSKKEEKEDDSDEDDEDAPKKEKIRKNKSGSTIERNEQLLNVKKFDLEFAVDPLFKKTCADFDEGGARGLLLNNLVMFGNGKIIFDSSDAKQSVSEIEDATPDTLTDIALLKNKYKVGDWCSLDVCPTFKNFEFNSSSEFSPEMQQLLDKIANHQQAEEDLDELVNFHDDNDYGGFNDDEPAYDPDVENSTTSNQEVEETITEGVTAVQSSIYSYFDDKLNSNWAGPEHWKLRPFFSKNSTEKKEKTKKAEKKAAFVDFCNAPAVDWNVLFSLKQSGTASLTLSKTQLQERSVNDYLLPVDLHFSSKDLLSYFTKPSWMLGNRKIKTTTDREFNPVLEESVLQAEDLNETYWAQQPDQEGGVFEESQQHEQTDEIPAYGTYDDDDHFGGFDVEDEEEEQGANPFYHGLELGFDFGNSLVTEPKLTKTIKMNYAKTAKKVDVRKLKENLWKDFEHQAPQKEIVPFSDLVQNLESVYKDEKLKEISVPFCFICLLHLANENNLEIKGTDDLRELYVKQE